MYVNFRINYTSYPESFWGTPVYIYISIVYLSGSEGPSSCLGKYQKNVQNLEYLDFFKTDFPALVPISVQQFKNISWYGTE